VHKNVAFDPGPSIPSRLSLGQKKTPIAQSRASSTQPWRTLKGRQGELFFISQRIYTLFFSQLVLLNLRESFQAALKSFHPGRRTKNRSNQAGRIGQNRFSTVPSDAFFYLSFVTACRCLPTSPPRSDRHCALGSRQITSRYAQPGVWIPSLRRKSHPISPPPSTGHHSVGAFPLDLAGFLAGLAQIPPRAPMPAAADAALLGQLSPEHLAVALPLLATATLRASRFPRIGRRLSESRWIAGCHFNHLRCGLGFALYVGCGPPPGQEAESDNYGRSLLWEVIGGWRYTSAVERSGGVPGESERTSGLLGKRNEQRWQGLANPARPCGHQLFPLPRVFCSKMRQRTSPWIPNQ